MSDRRTELWSDLVIEKVWEGFEESDCWVTVNADPKTDVTLIETKKTSNIKKL